MKSELFRKLAALMIAAALLLTGCGSVDSIEATPEETAEESLAVKFSDMVYEHPDYEDILAAAENAERALADGDADTAIPYLREFTELVDNFYVMYVLADIHNSIDMTDEFYADEYAYVSSYEASLTQLIGEVAEAVSDSSCSRKIEKQQFWGAFCDDYVTDVDYTDRVIELYERESELMADYRALIASPVITIDGQDYDYYDYMASCSYNQEYDAMMAYYYKYNPLIADIYIELMRVRMELAEELGYDSYEEMQYDYFTRDYTPEQGDDYIAAIKEYIVPVYLESSYYYSDTAEASVARDLMYDCVGAAAYDIGGDVQEAFKFMMDYELCDADVSTVKASGAYTTYIYGYNEPFVFIGATGAVDDIFSLAHEFGHFTDYYKNGSVFESLDVAECYSLGMEFLTLERLRIELEDDAVDDLIDFRINDALVTYVQQASFAEFENRAYDLGPDKLNAEVLNQISLDVAEEFGYMSPGYEEYFAMSWIDIGHFIEYPFYVISYTVSNDIALQIYEAELEHSGAGVKLYNRMLNRKNGYFMDFLDECGLKSPFDDGRVYEAAEFILSLL